MVQVWVHNPNKKSFSPKRAFLVGAGISLMATVCNVCIYLTLLGSTILYKLKVSTPASYLINIWKENHPHIMHNMCHVIRTTHLGKCIMCRTAASVCYYIVIASQVVLAVQPYHAGWGLHSQYVYTSTEQGKACCREAEYQDKTTACNFDNCKLLCTIFTTGHVCWISTLLATELSSSTKKRRKWCLLSSWPPPPPPPP